MNILKKLENLIEKEELAAELRKEKLPLVMWGAGELAEEISNYLKINNILLSDVFVDDEYYSEKKKFNGREVISYSMLVKKYKKVNLIIGNSNYEKYNFFTKMKLFEKVFYLFSVNYGIYEKTSKKEIEDNIIEFEKVYDLLEDEESKNVYLAFLKTRLSGNNSYIMEIYEKESNFFNNEIFRINQEEVFLEVGAYNGDTIRLFLKESNEKYRYIYAVEPDKENRYELQRYIEENRMNNIIVTDKGAWNEKGEVYFSATNEQISSVITEADEEIKGVGIEVNRLDDMFMYNEKVTILKINYLEGVKEAIQGAENILKFHKPKLAITVGFDCRNIRYIPILIKKINPEYKVFLRFNRGMISSLTCYAIV